MAEASESGESAGRKLCTIVVAASDGDRLVEQLVGLDLTGTKIGSTGGFLRRGSATVLSAVPSAMVSKVVAMLHREFPVRSEAIPAQQLPFQEDHETTGETVQVRVGGAVMFVLDISRFEQT
ncbi:MAG: cyclic-di-AMP receptor [Dehalococcoidia bacterium]|jgi:uncharacterized protein YaaQ|nr:cyclic-di-AMP receptor [Dehalococcoidia bacterium]